MRHRVTGLAFVSLIGSTVAAMILAATPSLAGAQVATGYIEICKTFTAGGPSFQGTFNYNISDGAVHTTATIKANQGGPQQCTSPIALPAGTATVTEVAAPWFKVTSITANQGDPGTVSGSTATGTATMSVLAGDQSKTNVVQYTNAPVDGVVEVCKAAASNSPSLTGTYTFNLTSLSAGVRVFDPVTGAFDLPYTATASATITSNGLACSGPLTVPAGPIQTVEPGTTNVTGITASSNGTNELIGTPNLATGTASANVLAGDTTNQTIVTYTDAISTVKLCKAWTGSATPTTSFPFTATSSGPPGPTAVTGSLGLTAGSCQILGNVRAGTQVNITEGVVAGTKVASIGAVPTTNSQGNSPIVPGTLSLPNRTVSVIAGAGETTVTFTDESAKDGQLKICVAPTANPTTGSVPFSVGGVQTINVNLSSSAVQCTLDPMTFSFNSAVTVAGGALPPTDAFTGTPTVVPTNVEVLEGGVPTATNQLSLAASTASSATVLMSEGIVTEVTFTVDPPAQATAPPVTDTPPTQVGGPVGLAGGSGVVLGTSPIVSANPVSGTSPVLGTSAIHLGKASSLTKALEKRLVSTKAEIKAVMNQLSRHHVRIAVRKADNKTLTALRKLERTLLKELG
jgi:hypothetical protein